jgi:hypothetical protein
VGSCECGDEPSGSGATELVSSQATTTNTSEPSVLIGPHGIWFQIPSGTRNSRYYNTKQH